VLEQEMIEQKNVEMVAIEASMVELIVQNDNTIVLIQFLVK